MKKLKTYKTWVGGKIQIIEAKNWTDLLKKIGPGVSIGTLKNYTLEIPEK